MTKRTPTSLGLLIKHHLSSQTMKQSVLAKKLFVTPSFLSAIIYGHKQPPSGFDKKLIKALNLNSTDAAILTTKYSYQKNKFIITPETPLQKSVTALLARKLDSLSNHQHLQIQALLSSPDH